jgi:outer membrane protein TolC
MTFELAELGYRNARISILDYLDAQRMLLSLEMQRVEQEVQREIIAADIVLCCLGRAM